MFLKRIKLLLTVSLCISSFYTTFAQVGINTLTPDNSAALEIASVDKGLLIPRMDTSAVMGPIALGLMVFQTTDKRFYYYNGTEWDVLGPAFDVTPFSKIIDSDNNTIVQVEKSPNDNIIRFDINGLEKMSIRNNASAITRIEMPNNNHNVAIGTEILSANTAGADNFGIGFQSLKANTTGSNNMAVGFKALNTNVEGSDNIGIGYFSMYFNDIGNYNVGLGSNTLVFNTKGSYNLAFGYRAMYNNIDGDNNIAIGNSSMFQNSSGINNVGIAKESLLSNASGNQNVAIGFRSLYEHETGDNNIALGWQALYSHENGANNVALGPLSFRQNITGSGNVGIGRYAGYYELGSNKLYIENSFADSTEALVFGNFENNYLRFNGNVGINTNAGVYPLSVGQGFYGFRMVQLNPASNPEDANWEFWIDDNTQALKLFKAGFSRGTFDQVSGAYTHVSDVRLKENIMPLNHVLDQLNELQPVRYNFIADKNKTEQIGFIAQDVEKLFPEFVVAPLPDAERANNYTLNYSGLSVIAIAAIQEQQVMIQEQQEKIDQQEERIKKLELALEELLKG